MIISLSSTISHVPIEILAAAMRQVSDTRMQYMNKTKTKTAGSNKLNATEENLLTQLTGLVYDALVSISQAYVKVCFFFRIQISLN